MEVTAVVRALRFEPETLEEIQGPGLSSGSCLLMLNGGVDSRPGIFISVSGGEQR